MSGSKVTLYEYNRSVVVSCHKIGCCIKLSLQWNLHPCHIPTEIVLLRASPSVPECAFPFLTYSQGI